MTAEKRRSPKQREDKCHEDIDGEVFISVNEAFFFNGEKGAGGECEERKAEDPQKREKKGRRSAIGEAKVGIRGEGIGDEGEVDRGGEGNE